MAILVLDFDLEQPPARVELGGYAGARLLAWYRRLPVGEVVVGPKPAVTGRELVEAAHRLFAAQIAENERRSHVRAPEWKGLVTVAICTRDRPEDLAICLGALTGQVDAPPHEILVVDNAPADERTHRLVDASPGIGYVRERRPGTSCARNRALQEARGTLVAFLDDDVVPSPTWLVWTTSALTLDEAVVGCSGPVLPAELVTRAQELFEARGGFTKDLSARLLGAEAPDTWSAPHWPVLAGMHGTGCNMTFRTDVLRELGGFDTALGPATPALAGEDHDVFFRLVRAGHAFSYEPGALVRHRHRRDMESLRRQMESWGRGTFAFLAKCAARDRSSRRRAVAAARWLLGDHVRRLVRSFGKKSPRRFPPSLVVAELAGSLKGPAAYLLSRRWTGRQRRWGGERETP